MRARKQVKKKCRVRNDNTSNVDNENDKNDDFLIYEYDIDARSNRCMLNIIFTRNL